MFTQNREYKRRQDILRDVREARKNIENRELFTVKDKIAVVVGIIALFVIGATWFFMHLAAVTY